MIRWFSVLTAVSCSGCAMLQGPRILKETVDITAVDNGRSVSIPAKIHGDRDVETILPSSVELYPRTSGETTVSIEHDCYQPSTTVLPQKRVSPRTMDLSTYLFGANSNSRAFDNEVIISLSRKKTTEPCVFAPYAQGVSQVTMFDMQSTNIGDLHKNNRLHLTIVGPFEYSGSRQMNFRFSGAGGLGVGYEYMLSDNIGINARFQEVNAANNNSSDQNTIVVERGLNTSAGIFEIVFSQYFSNPSGMHAGIGLGQQKVVTETLLYKTEINSQTLRYIFLSAGWRSSGTFYFGFDVHVTSPSLVVYDRFSGPKTIAVGETISEQDRTKAETTHKRLLNASYGNFVFGVAF